MTWTELVRIGTAFSLFKDQMYGSKRFADALQPGVGLRRLVTVRHGYATPLALLFQRLVPPLPDQARTAGAARTLLAALTVICVGR